MQRQLITDDLITDLYLIKDSSRLHLHILKQ